MPRTKTKNSVVRIHIVWLHRALIFGMVFADMPVLSLALPVSFQMECECMVDEVSWLSNIKQHIYLICRT